MSKLIVIHSTIYLCFLELNVISIVFNLVKNYEEQGILRLARTAAPHEKPCEKYLLEVQTTQVLEASCNLLAKGHWQLFIVFPFFLYPHYKSPYCLQNCKKSFREKTLETHERVRNCKPINNHLYISLSFLYFHPSQFPYPIRGT